MTGAPVQLPAFPFSTQVLASGPANGPNYKALASGMAKYGAAVSDGCSALGAEWLSFVNLRLQKDMAFPSRLAQCKNPYDLMKEWSEFMQTTADDYRSEFARLAEIGGKTSGAAIAAMQSGSA